MNKKVDKILNTTIRLFIREGIKKTTMDDIAKSSNASKVTIYKYFANKESLYFEISKYICSEYIEKLKSINISSEVVEKRLYDFLDIISDFTNSGKFELCGELAKFNYAIETEYELYLKTYRTILLNLIDLGIEKGLIRSDLDRDMIYYYIDMGAAYYQQNREYRNKMLTDSRFQENFLLFYINNIFKVGTKIFMR